MFDHGATFVYSSAIGAIVLSLLTFFGAGLAFYGFWHKICRKLEIHELICERFLPHLISRILPDEFLLNLCGKIESSVYDIKEDQKHFYQRSLQVEQAASHGTGTSQIPSSTELVDMPMNLQRGGLKKTKGNLIRTLTFDPDYSAGTLASFDRRGSVENNHADDKMSSFRDSSDVIVEVKDNANNVPKHSGKTALHDSVNLKQKRATGKQLDSKELAELNALRKLEKTAETEFESKILEDMALQNQQAFSNEPVKSKELSKKRTDDRIINPSPLLQSGRQQKELAKAWDGSTKFKK